MLECLIQEYAQNFLETQEETERSAMRTKIILLTIALLVTMGLLLAACGSKAKSTATQSSAPAQATVAPSTTSDGEALLNDRCTKCHSINRVTSAKKSASDWQKTVSRMVSNGAKLTSEEQQVLVDYLAKTYAP
jgi:cytochrome c5